MSTRATQTEINAQPAIWADWAPHLATQAAEIRAWITQIAPREIWLSGAGTSAFVGDILAGGRLRALPTTDLVACPGADLGAEGPVLAVQFGRSGNSSESLGMLDLLDQHRPDIHRLHITCNPEGALACRAAPGPGQLRALVLPEATHDAGFAMTSSFSTMLLSALVCLDTGVDGGALLPRMAAAAATALPGLWARPAPRPGRAVFLGAGALTGAARESALKVLELTAGATVTSWDSPLGFRHGPKALVDDQTEVFVMIHPDGQTARYDQDLAREVAAQFPQARVTTIGGAGCDIALDLTGDARADAALMVLPAQVFSVRWSQDLGLNVDNPFEGQGNLTRVVAGVTLYGWAP